jgi:hypothetical protein
MPNDSLLRAFAGVHPQHRRRQEDREHGGRYVTCLDCGAQFQAHATAGYGVDFELITEGDGHCDRPENLSELS